MQRIQRILFSLFLLTLSCVYSLGVQATSRCTELFYSFIKLNDEEFDQSVTTYYKNFLELEDLPEQHIHTYKNLKPVAEHTLQKAEAIYDYTALGYRELNKGLVAPFPRSSTVLQTRDLLIEELASLPAYKGKTYSGAILPREEYEKIINNQIFNFGYFFSTSNKESVGEHFLKSGAKHNYPQISYEKVPILFVIDQKSGRSIENYSKFKGESEILLGPEALFKITRTEKKRLKLTEAEYKDKELEILEGIPYHVIYIQEMSNTHSGVINETAKNIWQKLFNTKRNYKLASDIFQSGEIQRFGPAHHITEKQTYLNWERAHNKFVVNSNNHKINIKTLQAIHQEVMQGGKYIGYERRRVKASYKKGELTLDEAISILKNIDDGQLFTAQNHDHLHGHIRTSELDRFVYEGDHMLPSGERVIARDELEGLLANNYFKLADGTNIQPISEEFYKAQFVFPSGKSIIQEVQEVIYTAEVALSLANSSAQKVRSLAILEKQLLTIHPFLDGNGRTIRLFIDMILSQQNLPLPSKPLTKEYSSSISTLTEEMIKNMEEWTELRMK